MTAPADPAIIYLIDDDESVREGVTSLLRSIGLHVLSYADARDFLTAHKQDVPGCLVLDVRLPGLSGLDLQEQLASAKVDLPIIFITGHADIPMTVHAMKGGAFEFLTKPFREQELIDAVHRAIAIHRDTRDKSAALASLHSRYDTLSAREREVYTYVITGLLNKQIAAELGTSEITIKVHRAAVMQKMQADSLPDLVRMAERLGVASAKR